MYSLQEEIPAPVDTHRGSKAPKEMLLRAHGLLRGPGGFIAVQAFALFITLPRVSPRGVNNSQGPFSIETCRHLTLPAPFLLRSCAFHHLALGLSLSCCLQTWVLSPFLTSLSPAISSPTPSCHLPDMLSPPNPKAKFLKKQF